MTTPTAEQQDILAAAAEGHDLIKVSAGAGTGKTTTTMGVGRVPTWWEPGQQLYSTFGVAAGEDAGRKFADNPSVIVLRPGQLAARAAEPWQKRRLDAGKTRLKSADLA